MRRAAGSCPFTYQWQWQQVGGGGVWTNVVEGVNADSLVGGGGGVGVTRFTAAGAAALSIAVARSNTTQGTLGVISALRCTVTNSGGACGSVTSNPATLTLCIADTDNGSGTGICDGGVGIEDLLYYLTVYNAGTARADVDDGSATGTPDGGVGIEDLLYYLARYNAGC